MVTGFSASRLDPTRWSLAETVLNTTLLTGPWEWTGALGYAFGLGMIKARAAGRGDEDSQRSLLGMVIIEQLVESAADILRGKLILSPTDETEGAWKHLTAFRTLHQGEILAHLVYPMLVSEQLGTAIISTAATAALIHYQNVWNLNEIRRVLQVWQPTAAQMEQVYQRPLVEFMGMAAESAGYRGLDAWVRAVGTEGMTRGRVPLRMMAVMVDPLQRKAFLPLGLLRGTLQIGRNLGTLGEWIGSSRWWQQHGGTINEWGRSLFEWSVGYAAGQPGVAGVLDATEMAALRHYIGIDAYELMKLPTEEMYDQVMSAYRQLASMDKDFAERFLRTMRNIELGSLSSRATMIGIGLGITMMLTSSVLPALLDRIMPGPANPIHTRLISQRRRDRDVLDESATSESQPPEEWPIRQMRRYVNSLGWRHTRPPRVDRVLLGPWSSGGGTRRERESEVRVEARRRSVRSPRFQRDRRIRRELQLDREVP